MNLQSAIQSLSARFATDLVGLLRTATLDEIVVLAGAAPSNSGAPLLQGKTETAPTKPARITARLVMGRAARLRRRSRSDIDDMVAGIVELVKKNPAGVNAETIRADLKIDRRELPKPLKMALETSKIRKRGKKRGTLYLPA